MTELRKVTEDNLWDIIKLTVNEDQKHFVASNTNSILEAYVAITSGQVALPFGIYEDGALAGFAMLGYTKPEETEDPEFMRGNYCLWRFMIDKSRQKQGIGRRALGALIEYMQNAAPCGRAEACWLSYEPENEVGRKLYASMGFIENGEICGGEVVAVRKLD